MKRSQISSYDKKTLSVLEWYVADPRGVVQLVHSKSEHAARFDAFAKYLNTRGYLVYSFDLRGHGETDKHSLGFGYGDVFLDSIKDMAFLAKQYKERYPKTGHAVLGRGYGAFLTLAFTERYPQYTDASILCGVLRTDFLLVNRVICTLSHKLRGENFKSKIVNYILNMGSLDGLNLSGEKEVVKTYNEDKSCGFDCSNGFYSSYLKGAMGAYKKEEMEKISYKMPIMIMSGASDKLGGKGRALKKLEKSFSDIGVKADVSLYEGALHDLLSDCSREKACSDVAGFLDEKI